MATPALPAPSPEITPSPATPPSPTPVVPAAPAAPGAPPAAPDSRAAIYERYYASVTPPATPAAVDPAAAPPPSVEPPAAPAVPVPAATPSSLSFDDLTAKVEEAVVNAIAKLGASAAPSAAPAEPATPPPPPDPAASDWLALLQQGKRAEAEAVMAEKFTAAAREQSVTQALELFRVEREVETFLSDLRSKPENAAILPMEGYISFKVSQRLAAAQAAGKIRDNAAFLTEYKAAVNAEADEARKLVQQLRAAGSEAAMTIRKEVVAASTLPPNAIEQPRGVAAPSPEPKLDTYQDYLSRRRDLVQKRMGLAM